MEIVGRSLLAKSLYGALFVVALPLALVVWAYRTRELFSAELFPREFGLALIILGLLIIVVGMTALSRRGGGLPMNAFPPPRYVHSGIYALVPHPIYGGFVILCAGIAIRAESSSGLWLITPTVAIASAALVLGYELPDLRHRFGDQIASPWLPADADGAPSLMERLRTYPVVLLPWFVLYESIVVLGLPHDAVSTYLPFERHLPVIEWTEAIYASTYLVVVATPFLVGSKRALRAFASRGLVSMAVVFPLFLLLPLIADPRRFMPYTPLGDLLAWERSIDSAVAAFPSYHVVWACIAAASLGRSSRLQRWLWTLWALAVGAACVTTGMHSIIDVFGGFLAFALVCNLRRLWIAILNAAEHLANSWHEWRIGPMRVINHGGYAALAALVGMWLIDSFLGPGHQIITGSIFVGACLGAALWAQWVEGSPSLLRPLGFYGGMLGAIVGSLLALYEGVNLWIVLAAVCVAAPFIQALGRLRCLVQGCCHGRPTEGLPGIRHTHPRSRVVRLSKFAGVPVHATAVYSILWNAVIAAVLFRLLFFEVPATVICGMYLILSGVGRFVEEAYRGEPQTAIFGGLRLYQWIAVATIISGAIITTASNSPAAPRFTPSLASIPLALACGVAAWFLTGVDFPESNRRFARLT